MPDVSEHDEWVPVIRYIDTVRPGFSSRIRPASAAQLSQLEAAIGRPLYPLYRRYLEHMGAFDDGLLERPAGYSTTIEELIERAIEIRDDECGSTFFEEYFEIGAALRQVYGLRVSGVNAGRIVVLGACKEDERHQYRADSLLSFVHTSAFAQERWQLALQSALIVADLGRADDILGYARDHFQGSEYSDSVHWLGRQRDVLLDVTFRPKQTQLWFSARSVSRAIEEAERVAQALQLPAPTLEENP